MRNTPISFILFQIFVSDILIYYMYIIYTYLSISYKNDITH